MLSWQNIVAALENKKYKWRTIRGIAKELQADELDITKLLNMHLSDVIKSSVPANTGEDLFTTRNHYRRTTSSILRFASSLTNTVAVSGGEPEDWTVASMDKKKEEKEDE